MGVLSEILAGNDRPLKKTEPEFHRDDTPENLPPVFSTDPVECLCDHHGAGERWRDAYGNWHCMMCRPPRVPVMAIEIVGSCDDFWPVLPGLSVSWVRLPDGEYVFPPGTTERAKKCVIEEMATYGW